MTSLDAVPAPASTLVARVCAGALSLSFVSGCGGASSDTASGTGPLDLDADRVVLLEHTEALAEVKDLTVLPDGEVWVLNSLEPLFVGFGADGRLVREHGALGGGPAEFGAPTAFVAGDVEGEAWVFDAERHALIEVSGTGEARGEMLLPSDESLPKTALFGGREIIGGGPRPARLGGAYVFAVNEPDFSEGMLSFWRSIWSADLVAWDPATSATRRVVSLAESLGRPDQAFERAGDFPPFPFWFRLWTVCAGEVRVYDRPGNQVRSFGADGSERASDTLPAVQRRDITREQMARVGFGLGMLEAGGELSSRATPEDSARIITRLSGRIEGDPEQLDTLLPRYVDLRCGEDGTLWLRRYDVDRGALTGGRTWLRMAADGGLLEVIFPERFDPLWFSADRAWGVQRDAFDVATVGWVPLG